MDPNITLLAQLADDEFDGESFNGPSFMKTLESLDCHMAAWTDTHEGYSAWTVALHVAYFKHFMATGLDPATPAYPLQKGKGGFGVPSLVTDDAWREVLAYLREIHSRVMSLIRAADARQLAQSIPRWEVPFAKGIAWLCGHDAYHAAQLRSMGVPGLKEPKEG